MSKSDYNQTAERERRRIEKLRPHPGEGHPRRPLRSLPFRERMYWRLFGLFGLFGGDVADGQNGGPTYADAECAYRAFCAELARVRANVSGGGKPEVQPAWEFLSVSEKSAWLKACEALKVVERREGMTRGDFPWIHFSAEEEP